MVKRTPSIPTDYIPDDKIVMDCGDGPDDESERVPHGVTCAVCGEDMGDCRLSDCEETEWHRARHATHRSEVRVVMRATYDVTTEGDEGEREIEEKARGMARSARWGDMDVDVEVVSTSGEGQEAW